MSIHPSLRIDPAAAKQRSVLSRIERIKDLMKKGLWSDKHDVTGLPKTRVTRIKAKKAAKAAAPESATAAAPGSAAAAKTAAAASAADAKTKK
ncbi:MAG: small basic protein [Candidatus Omnitrophota bacterium]